MHCNRPLSLQGSRTPFSPSRSHAPVWECSLGRSSGQYVEVVSFCARRVHQDRLARLMIDHQVGVRHTPVPMPKLDLDFWEEA
jgi:hypothetical protein